MSNHHHSQFRPPFIIISKLYMCMCVCMYKHTHVYTHAYTYMHMYTRVHIHAYTYIHMHVCICAHTHTYIYERERDLLPFRWERIIYNELKWKIETLCIFKLSPLSLFIMILHTNDKEIKEEITYLEPLKSHGNYHRRKVPGKSTTLLKIGQIHSGLPHVDKSVPSASLLTVNM